MTRTTIRTLTALATAAAALSAHATLSTDADVTNAVIYGSGNANGGFTVDRANNVELGLRAKVRYPAPANTFNSNGDGSYSMAVGGYGPSGTRASWNFDFSINSDLSGTAGRQLDALTYVLGMDFDPSQAASFSTLDPAALPDNSFGDNSTAEGAGVEPGGADTTASLMARFNLMQNSENLDFFNEAFSKAFDPTADGTYSFYLAAFDGQRQVARTDISVIVGQGGAAVPEPASLALVGLALAGAAAASRRRAR